MKVESEMGTVITISIPIVVKTKEGVGCLMIRIVIAEDQRILRGALGTLLDFEEDMKVVGQAENGEQAIATCPGFTPRCLYFGY